MVPRVADMPLSRRDDLGHGYHILWFRPDAPIVGTVIRKVGHLTVERRDPGQSAADAERATARLRAGVSLLFFPEGTFRRGPGLLPFRLGAFKAAVELADKPNVDLEAVFALTDVIVEGLARRSA